MYGNDYRYAATRLDDSIARLKDGTPVYIHHVQADGTVFYYHMEDMDKVGKAPQMKVLEDFNLEPVPLGYVNSRTGCTYVSRMPVRKWKQGLRINENCSANYGGVINAEYKAISDTIKGIFPKFDEVVKRVVGDKKNPFKKVAANTLKAWHRFWAYDANDQSVFYRGDIVGTVKDGQVVLAPRYKYLQECLMESV